MGEKRTFSATIERAGSGGAYVIVPFDVEEAFGKKRVPVQASIDGVPYRGSLVRMGGAAHVLGILKEIREQLGKEPGDTVEVTVEEDTAAREVELPADLRAALEASEAAAEFFRTLAYSHQREYVRWIEEAKRGATRNVRIARTIELLEGGAKQR